MIVTQSEGTSEIETDAAWLREFVETGSETAFQSLVEKYLSLTLAIAVRRTGNRTLAEEIDELATDDAVEAELAALRSRLGRSEPDPAPGTSRPAPHDER